MTPGRRALAFGSLDEVMPDVDHLLRAGYTTVGKWSLGQICRHLAVSMRRVVDLPASTPVDPTLRLSDEATQAVFASGTIPEGMAAPDPVLPPEGLDAATEAEGLRAAIAYYQASPGPVAPHRFFGPLNRDQWDRLQAVHCAHHLSFAVPKA
jgi:hypothetical protein